MRTIALLSQKGGSGKSTLACAIAAAAEHAGHTTVLVDLDPQGSTQKWGQLREAQTPIITGATPERLAAVLKAAEDAGASRAVIDTAPHASHGARQAAETADIAIIPCRPSAPDITAIGATIAIARDAGAKQIHAVVNGALVHSPLITQAQGAIARYGIGIAPVTTHQRIDHVHAYTRGLSAAEFAPHGHAAAEIQALYAWLDGELPP